jgi:hypothetical protein
MGYTHYFSATRKFTDAEWKTLCDKTNSIIKSCNNNGIPIQYEYDDPNDALVDDECIRFNGAEDDGHETFVLLKRGSGFAFCKTGYKPYDLAVCMVLLAAGEVAPGCLKVGSDGQWDDEWLLSREKYKELFGDEVVLSKIIEA